MSATNSGPPVPDRSPPQQLLACPLAGLAAGLLVGLLDGTRAGLLAHLDFPQVMASALLVGGVDGLLGGLAGTVAGLLCAVTSWGRARSAPPLVARLVWTGVGALAGGAGALMVLGTAQRNNRFLAAGVVVLVSLAASVAGALVGPAAARFVTPASALRPPAPPVTWGGLLLVSPLLGLLLETAVFLAVWRTRTPLRLAVRTERMIIVFLISAALPGLLAWGSGRLPRCPGRRALLAAAALFGLPLALLLGARWLQDFRFLPWTDIMVMALVAGVTTGMVWAQRHRRFRLLPTLLIMAGGLLGSAALVLGMAGSEAARKATALHAGVAGPLLGQVRTLFDFDRDGYPRWLGGGDCNDHDPKINPGEVDWPEDDIDQDCDGHDATATAPTTWSWPAVPATVPPNLNVLFVTVDTLRADHLHAYGYGRPTSPHIDELAAQSVFFTSGWAHAPSTRFSMPALATSRWPSAITWEDCPGCDLWWPRFAADQTTIGEAFKNLGYTTAAMYAYSYFDKRWARGFERGIDVYEDRRSALHVNVEGPKESVGSSAREISDDAIAFVNQHKDEKFFFWLHYYDPHLSYERHPEAPAFGNQQADLYDGEVWYTDHHLGRVLARLRELGIYDRTAIALTGDHGEGFGEHGIVAHGYDLYAPQTKVPFLVRVPGIAPRRVTTPVGHIDLAPTLVNLAGGQPIKTFLGRSMVDLMTGSPRAPLPPPVFQEVNFEGPVQRRALVTEDYHLIWRWVPDNTTECYDLRQDPGELRDLWGTAAGSACGPLKIELRNQVASLSLPADFRAKMAAGVFAAGAQPAAPTHPLMATIGTAVQVVGYDLSAPTVRPGGQVEITYHLKLLAPLPAGYKPFFHLGGPTGYRNVDHVPVQGMYPVQRWRPGQQILDRQTLSFPSTAPPGVYTVYMGMYRGGERLPISPRSAGDAENRLVVATINLSEGASR